MNFFIKHKKNILFILISYFVVFFIYTFNFDLIKGVKFNLTIYEIIFIILFKILTLILISLRWSLVSSFFNFNFNFLNSFKQITFGQFFSIFIPSSIAIDYFKIKGLIELNDKLDLPVAAGVDFFDRIIGVISFIIINSFFVIIFFINHFSVFYIILFFFITLISIFFLIFFITKLLNSSKRYALTKGNKLKINYKNISVIIFLGLTSHFIDLMSLLLVSNSIFDLPIINQLSMISASQFSILISITPSSIGISENFFQFIFNFFHDNSSSINAFDIPFIIRMINYILLSVLTILIFLILKFKYIKNYLH
tara:strand:+ start:907 stop:1836 length:930 start_codon:yes stop_codon:yes gene_type:complete